MRWAGCERKMCGRVAKDFNDLASEAPMLA